MEELGVPPTPVPCRGPSIEAGSSVIIKTKEYWKPDNLAQQCGNCHETFTMYLRRHHCRLCGDIFCKRCSRNGVLDPLEKKWVRTCDTCYRSVKLTEVTTHGGIPGEEERVRYLRHAVKLVEMQENDRRYADAVGSLL